MTKVHYFFDPMCGWCFGASSLIKVLSEHSNVEIQYHPGGMIPKRAIDASFRQHILQADQQIAALTHATFGEDYIKRVASHNELVIDSYATTQAFYAGQQLGIDGYTMLSAIQSAHYVDGLHVDKEEALTQVAVSLGLEASAWQTAFAQAESVMKSEIQATQKLMPSMHVRGYPTLIMETNEGLRRLPHSDFYGKPEAWKDYLERLA